MKRANVLIGLALAAACLAQPVLAYTMQKVCFNGYGYKLHTRKLRYIEHHEQHLRDGRVMRASVTYYDPKGRILATKTLNYAANAAVPAYTFNIKRKGYMEGIRHKNGRWVMMRRKSRHAKVETKAFKITADTAADAGFDPLVRKNFAALMAGKTVNFRFAVAGHQSVINMEAEKTGTTTFEGKPAVIFKAKLDMFFFDMFVKPLYLTYDPHSKRLLEYRGVGNMHNSDGDVYPVRVSYYSHVPPQARNSGVPPHCIHPAASSAHDSR